MTVDQEQSTARNPLFELLAMQSRLPADEIARIYAAERAELASQAAVTAFLDVFAVRNVRQRLREQAAAAVIE